MMSLVYMILPSILSQISDFDTTLVIFGSISETVIKQQSGKLKRQPGDFPPASKITLFLGSLSSSRNHARSPPDGFLISLLDCFITCTIVDALPSSFHFAGNDGTGIPPGKSPALQLFPPMRR